jgi:hypothetical protein
LQVNCSDSESSSNGFANSFVLLYSFMTLDDTAVVTEASEESYDGTDSDTSLNDFLRNLRSRNAPHPVQKSAHGTQTPSVVPKRKVPHIPTVRSSHDRDKNVIAVMAPNPYLRGSTEVSYYALTEYTEPELHDVASSMSVKSERSAGTRLHHPPVHYDTLSRHATRPPKAPTRTASTSVPRAQQQARQQVQSRLGKPVASSAPSTARMSRSAIQRPKVVKLPGPQQNTPVVQRPKVVKLPGPHPWH